MGTSSGFACYGTQASRPQNLKRLALQAPTSTRLRPHYRIVPHHLDDHRGWCQTNSNSSQLGQCHCPLCRAETAPLGESGGAVGLEERSAGEAALAVEMVGDGGVDGGEHLQTSHAPEPKHRPLPSSEREV